jgi:HEAT repeat protein
VTNSKKRSKKKENLLVLRAAAHSLGQVGSRAGVPALLAALQDQEAESDVRREAATALGLIGDKSALPALNSLLSADDPYLSRAALEASRQISRNTTP